MAPQSCCRPWAQASQGTGDWRWNALGVCRAPAGPSLSGPLGVSHGDEDGRGERAAVGLEPGLPAACSAAACQPASSKTPVEQEVDSSPSSERQLELHVVGSPVPAHLPSWGLLRATRGHQSHSRTAEEARNKEQGRLLQWHKDQM